MFNQLMLSHSELSTSLSKFQAAFDLKSFSNVFQVQTTSFDGRPLLTPSEFRCLFMQDQLQKQQKSFKSQRNRDSSHKRSTECSESRLEAKNTDYSSEDLKTTRQNSDLDEFENIRKRVKSEDSSSNPSTNCENLSMADPCSPNLSSICETSEQELIQPEENILILPENENIVKAVFDYDSEQIKFHIQQAGENSEDTHMRLTRDEVLERDPKLLLYFYESHLQFAKRADFDVTKLRKA